MNQRTHSHTTSYHTHILTHIFPHITCTPHTHQSHTTLTHTILTHITHAHTSYPHTHTHTRTLTTHTRTHTNHTHTHTHTWPSLSPRPARESGEWRKENVDWQRRGYNDKYLPPPHQFSCDTTEAIVLSPYWTCGTHINEGVQSDGTSNRETTASPLSVHQTPGRTDTCQRYLSESLMKLNGI